MSDSLLGKLKQTPDPGDVFWLLKKKDVDPSLCSIKSLRDKAFNHPVLVLSIDQRAQIADVLILTSLGGRSLFEYSHLYTRSLNKAAKDRSRFLPISPTPAHPDDGSIVYLADNVQLDKDTYINIEKIYHLPFSFIRPLWQDDQTVVRTRVESDSFQYLIERLNARSHLTLRTTATDTIGDCHPSEPARICAPRLDEIPALATSNLALPAIGVPSRQIPQYHWEEDDRRLTVKLASSHAASPATPLLQAGTSDASPEPAAPGRKIFGLLLALAGIGTLFYCSTKWDLGHVKRMRSGHAKM